MLNRKQEVGVLSEDSFMEIQFFKKRKESYWNNFICGVAALPSGVDLNQFHYMQKDSNFLGQILPKCIFAEICGVTPAMNLA